MWKSNQFAAPIVLASSAFLAIGIVLLISSDISTHLILLTFVLVPVLTILFFYKLSIVIFNQVVTIKLGVGLIRKSINISDVSNAEPVENSGFAGWGFRVLPSYTMYNVSGFKAVEISLKTKRRKIRVGTPNPIALAKVVNDMVEKPEAK